MTVVAQEHQQGGFFRKHLRGDYSLGRSYWVNTFLVQLLAPALGLMLLPWLSSNFPARYGAAGSLLVTTIGLIAWVWAVIGTWNAADKHVSRGGQEGWATAAKFMIVLGALRLVGGLNATSGQLREAWMVALGNQLGPEVSFQVRADGKSLLVSGGINDGTSADLAKALELAPGVRTVVLHSEGGWVRQGKMIADVIRERQLSTYVEDECTSACTIAFLAGKERAADPDARIGFHSFSSVGLANDLSESGNVLSAQQVYGEAGLSSTFIARVTATPADSVWYPTHDELLAAGVLTRQSSGGETATIATEVTSRAAVTDELRSFPIFGALYEVYPRRFELLVDTVWALVEARRPDHEVSMAVADFTATLHDDLIPIASERTLVLYIAHLLDQADYLSSSDPGACVRVVYPSMHGGYGASSLPPESVQKGKALMEQMIRESDPALALKVSTDEFRRVAMRTLGAIPDEAWDDVANYRRNGTEAARACEGVLAYLHALNDIPRAERPYDLRVLLSPRED